MKKQDEYFLLEEKIRNIDDSDLSRIHKIKNKMELHERRMKLLPYVDFTKGKDAEICALENPFPWSVGAPLPQVFSNDSETYLMYILSESHDIPDSTPILSSGNTSVSSYQCALVSFSHCLAVKHSGINDEVLHGHPYFSKGLEYYSLCELKNSSWLAKIQKIHAVHLSYSPNYWNSFHHYIFPFHDSLFECIAREYITEIYQDSIYEVAKIALEKLYE